MGKLRVRAARPVRHEALWGGLAALIALILAVGVGVTTVAAPPRDAGTAGLLFALAPSLAWTVASLVIGRFVAAALRRQDLLLSAASSLLIAGALTISGGLCLLPYEFWLTDVAGLAFDVVVPLWAFGTLLLVASLAAHALSRRL